VHENSDHNLLEVTYVEELYSQVKVEDNGQQIIIELSQTQTITRKIKRKLAKKEKRKQKKVEKQCSNKRQKVEGKV